MLDLLKLVTDYKYLLFALVISIASVFVADQVYYSPRLENTSLKLEQFESAYKVLSEAVVQQNTEVDSLKVLADNRAKENKVAQDKAKVQAKGYYSKAENLANLKMKPDEDECKQIIQLINEELVKE